MGKKIIALVLVLAALAPISAETAHNPLDGHRVELELPPLGLELRGDTARTAWDGRFELYIDGRLAATAPLPTGTAQLPRRRWGLGDWLAFLGGAAVAAAVGAAGGYLYGHHFSAR